MLFVCQRAILLLIISWNWTNIHKYLLVSVISLVIFFGLVQGAEAANHYVRSGATGANNGSDWTNAWTSLPSTFFRGDTYYIADGSYSGYTFNTAASGSTYITIKKATASDHGTDIGWVSTYGDSQSVFSGELEFNSPYWLIDGVTGGGIENNWTQNLGFKIIETRDAYALIRINYGNTGAGNITVRHVEMQGKGSASSQGGYYSNHGISIYSGSSNNTLSHAWMHGIGSCPVAIYASGGFTIFEAIYVESFYGSGTAHSEVMSAAQGPVGDTTWRYSLIADSQSTGGLMWDNQHSPNAHLYIYGNIFYQPAGAKWTFGNGLIGGWTGGNGEEFRNCWVYNNTFINVQYLPLSNFPKVYSGNIAYNNIFYNTASPDFSRFATHDYNYFINSGGAHSETHGTSAASGDPFVDYVNLNFALNGATAAGMPLSSPLGIALDPLGYTRGSDGTWDRGAFEYVSGSTQPAYTLTVAKSGSGSGTVSGTGIDCGSDCTETVNAGVSITLTASPDSDSVFSGWSGGGCSGTGTCTVTMNSNTTVTASFTQSEPPSGLIEAETGTLTSPMQIISDTQVSGGQYIQTTVGESGTATYTFNIPTTGIYKIVAMVYAPSLTQDSLFFKIDSQTEDVWDFNPPETSEGYNVWREDEITKRGTGTVNNPQYDPYTLELTQGNHTLTFRGREAYARLDYFRFVQTNDTTPPAAPTGLSVQ